MKRPMENLVLYPRRQNVGEGYADQTMDTGFLAYTNVRDLLANFFLTTHFNVYKVANWRDMCIGISSGYFFDPREMREPMSMPMFDYDGRHARATLKKDVTLLQEKYGAGPATIYKTKRGCHVYFFCDSFSRTDIQHMLEDVNCCEGFKRSTRRRGYSVLRVSAKYTDFDIEFDSVIPDPRGKLKRKTAKAHVVEYLLGLGKECGTHFASLFPQWAHYQEDQKPWKQPRKRDPHEKGKLIRKVAKIPDLNVKPPAGEPMAVDFEQMEKQILADQVMANKKLQFAQMYNGAGQQLANNWISTTSSTVTFSPAAVKNDVWYTYET